MGGVRIGGVAVPAPTPGLLPWSMYNPDTQLFIMDTGSLLALSPASVFDLQVNPILSPNGQVVAFRDYTDPDAWSAIYVVPIDGTAAAGPLDPTYQLWNNGTGDLVQAPSWRPDGGAIVCTDASPEGTYVGATNGGKVVRVTYPAGVATTLWLPEEQSPTQREEAWRPVYSPDGTMIAFFVNVAAGGGGTFARQGLWVMDADGTSPTLIDALDTTTADGGYQKWGTQAVWSHDSAWIAYTTRTTSGTGGDLYKIAPDGSGQTLLKSRPDASNFVWIGWGAWTDDDTQVLCSAYEVGSGNSRLSLFLADADGSGSTEIKNGAGVNDGPQSGQNKTQAWRLNDRIYWIADNSPMIIYSCALDGTDAQAYYDGTADGSVMSGGVEWN